MGQKAPHGQTAMSHNLMHLPAYASTSSRFVINKLLTRFSDAPTAIPDSVEDVQ